METREFGQAVRRWRDRVAPEAVGLPHGGRRRAEGLRREELAGLAGISVDYLTRLEQGRATSPSMQVLEALARALRLSDPERELLFRLAGQAAPGPGLVSSRIPPSVQRLLDRLTGNPVVVYDAMWNLIVANAGYEALTGASAWQGIERNGVWRNVVGPGPAAVHTPEQLAEQQEGIVADLRLTAAKYPNDPRVKKLVAELRTSPLFTRLWESAELRAHDDRSRHKYFDHPAVGRIGLDCDTLIVAGDDLRIMVYSAEPGSEDAERLELAIVLGTQALAN
ncbi:helix-turn-helix transcriptional regulator [Gryllotalpicola daejeonensis]|uniref:Helix-turn-helix transcriptional regulator n=1 Tax=Gryllotalpicola daejeonensis TaxID=993087 RepID=A0ABP7ZJD7_9MICO